MNEYFKHMASKNEKTVLDWENEYNMAVSLLKGQTPKANHIVANFQKSSIAPWLTFVRIDALKPENYPNGISDNSVFVTFKVDHMEKKVEVWRTGHVWISDIDKENHPQFRYLAMHSMLRIAKENKCKGIRKAAYKNAPDLAEKMAKAFNNIMDFVEYYTGGYPYKQGVNDIIKA